MKQRTDGFLADDKVDHNGEIFDYILELHLILWEFCRYFRPGCGGTLSAWIDQIMPEVRSAALADNPSLREIKDKLDSLAESQGKLLAAIDDLSGQLRQVFDVQAYMLRCEDYLGAQLMRLNTIVEEAALMPPPRKARKKARR